MTDYIPNNLEELYQFPPQDPHDPVWSGDETIHGMTSVDDPNDDVFESRQTTAIRKADGGLDFLNEIETELRAAFSDGSHEPTRKRKPKLDTIATKDIAADKWRPRNMTIGTNPVKVATESAERRRIEIRNRTSGVAVGNGRVYLSSVPAVANGSNTIELDFDALNPDACRVTLYTKDDVFAVCATGDGAILDIIEEFDMEC